VKKSSCLRVEPRHKVTCAEITTSDGTNHPWVNEIRYLGIFIVSFVSFRCSIDHAKRSFYRAANAIFAKVGRFASEEVIAAFAKNFSKRLWSCTNGNSI